MPIDPDRKGPSRPTDVADDVRRALSLGEIPSVNLAEGLAVEFHVLLPRACPLIGEAAVLRMAEAEQGDKRQGITKRMRLAAELLLDRTGPGGIDQIAGHTSDTVRGWACTMIGLMGERDQAWDAARQLQEMRPFADDPHYGVREWAWMGARRAIIDELPRAIEILSDWAGSHRPNVRRFAIEATRPRGVWCPHIESLKADPEPGLALLKQVREDPEKYVQDATANWLNDAGKTCPEWVMGVTERWLSETDSKHTARIVKRARRNL